MLIGANKKLQEQIDKNMTYVALSEAAKIFKMAGARWECQYPLMECQASEVLDLRYRP